MPINRLLAYIFIADSVGLTLTTVT